MASRRKREEGRAWRGLGTLTGEEARRARGEEPRPRRVSRAEREKADRLRHWAEVHGGHEGAAAHFRREADAARRRGASGTSTAFDSYAMDAAADFEDLARQHEEAALTQKMSQRRARETADSAGRRETEAVIRGGSAASRMTKGYQGEVSATQPRVATAENHPAYTEARHAARAASEKARESGSAADHRAAVAAHEHAAHMAQKHLPDGSSQQTRAIDRHADDRLDHESSARRAAQSEKAAKKAKKKDEAPARPKAAKPAKAAGAAKAPKKAAAKAPKKAAAKAAGPAGQIKTTSKGTQYIILPSGKRRYLKKK